MTDRYRLGEHYGIHVYEGDRPVATFHDAEEAKIFVAAVNGAEGFREALNKARSKRYCGCAWCCAGTLPESRGEGHKICRAP